MNKKLVIAAAIFGFVLYCSGPAEASFSPPVKIILSAVSSGAVNPRLDCSPCHDYSSEDHIYREKCLNTGCVCGE